MSFYPVSADHNHTFTLVFLKPFFFLFFFRFSFHKWFIWRFLSVIIVCKLESANFLCMCNTIDIDLISCLFWLYGFHRAPAMSIVQEMSACRYKPAVLWCLCQLFQMFMFVTLKIYRLDPSDGPFNFSQSKYLDIKKCLHNFSLPVSVWRSAAVKVRVSLGLGVGKKLCWQLHR